MADATTETLAETTAAARRPIAARKTRWAASLASKLAESGVSPNAISMFSIVCGLFAGGAYLATRDVRPDWGDGVLYLAAIVGIQGRLLCNLFDGMVAVEGGKKSKSGEIFNDLPDRIADPLILIGAGYAADLHYGATLGWAAALMAVMTAYARVLGRSVGSKIYFVGPMAKQHRMAVLTVTNLICAVMSFAQVGYARCAMSVALAIIVLGSGLTTWRRVRLIVADLEAK